jgi:SAM-dependent methyltransferase
MDDSTFRYYQNYASELARRYETADVQNLHKRLLATFPAGYRLLEIGCGSGREAAFLFSSGYEVHCIEPSQMMIEKALQYHPDLEGRIFEGAVPGNVPEHILSRVADSGTENLNGTGQHYDGIYAVASLMHLSEEELTAAFELLYSALKPGGCFLFSVPLTRPDISASGYDSKGRYFLLLSTEEWTGHLEKVGFSHIDSATNPDGMGRRSVTWLTCTAEK